MKRQSSVRIGLVIFTVATVGSGFWTAPQAFAQGGPCAGDAAKFCGDVQPGRGRIIKCMKEHENNLSAECRAHLAVMKQKRQEAREACADDVARFCGDVQPGRGRIIKCMKEHENDLSQECRAKMQQRRPGRER